MRIAIVCSNSINIDEHAKKGTEIFCYTLIHELARAYENGLRITAFASGASSLPVPIRSIQSAPSSADPEISAHGKHMLYELALLGDAFSLSQGFDLFHINIGDGDMALPFARFVDKPILITLHHLYDAAHTRDYFSLFRDLTHVSFVSVSDAQRRILPDLPYAGTVYHGVEEDRFTFDPKGGDRLMWAGRLIPEKGADAALDIAVSIKRPIAFFGIRKPDSTAWREEWEKRARDIPLVSLAFDRERFSLAAEFRASRVFLFPVAREEDFGLTVIEAMASGTPVVAYARGSMPEIIVDDKTGFLVNPSSEDIRGEWLIKETGIEGLKEAVSRIYAMREEEYRAMRRACRERVEEHFTAARMAEAYIKLYKRLAGNAERAVK